MRKKTGNIGEQYAASYLESLGYFVVGQNFYTRFGEIDIIAQKNNRLVFVEVKTRRNNNFGYPEESITRTKAIHLRRAIYKYIQNNRGIYNWRVDVIAIMLNSFDEVKDLRHYTNVNLSF